jgi:hypothetical protein
MPTDRMTAAEYLKVAASEHGEQVALFQRAEAHYSEYPELRLLFAVPNGGLRDKRVAAKLKREGVKAGCPDICLPVARKGFHSLFIEMKSDSGRPSREQLDWVASLQKHGNKAVICYSQEQAWQVLVEYLI